MKRRDEGKASLVEFLRSIKYSHSSNASGSVNCATHFAHFEPRTHTGRQISTEDSQLIRSAN